MGRALAIGLLPLLFAACSIANTVTDGTGNVLDPRPNQTGDERADDTTGKELGLRSGTEDYSICRLRLRQARAAQPPPPQDDLGF